jgi:hypothetical protein
MITREFIGLSEHDNTRSDRDTLEWRDKVLGIPHDSSIDWAHRFAVVAADAQSIILPVMSFDRVPLIPDDYSSPSHFAYLIEFIPYDNKNLRYKIATHVLLSAEKYHEDFLFPLTVIAYAATDAGSRLLKLLGFEPARHAGWWRAEYRSIQDDRLVWFMRD